MVVTVCPSRETLLEYSLGMLSGQQRDALDSHLDCCPDCQATIMTLDDADDTVIGRLRMPLSSESVLAEPQLQDVLAAAMAMPAGDCPDFRGEMDAAREPRVLDAKMGLSPSLCPDMPEMLGEYRLLAELGRGGMGRVYKALHTKLDRVVAVKVLPRGLGGDRKTINRFEREMKAVGRLAHANIVQAHDAREIDDMPVLIMEFVDGLDLAEIVRRVGPLPTADACELVRQTALALEYAHEHGLVHRDIKPSNIMLARSGDVKLLDLGLARFYAEATTGEEMTGAGQAMGTADYMAPEQASDSRRVDIRADLYSLGCTLYKLLSGRAPFSGRQYAGALEKLNAHVHQPVPPVRDFAPDVHEELVAILDRMLAKAPGERFATPAEVAEAVVPWCAGADLPALLRRAEASVSSPLPPGENQSVGGPHQPLLPLGEGQGRPHAAAQRWKSVVGLAVLLLLVGGLGFTLGIMIRITKDGRETTVEVPPGSTARIGPDGQVNVELPGQAKSKDVGLIKSPLPAGAEAVAAQPLVPAAAELKALQPRAMIGTGVAQASGALSAGTYAPATPLEVPVIRPIRRQLTRHEDFTGRIEAAQTVDVRARATGNIEKIHFKGGMMVKKGDLLLEIDPRSDQAECDRAMANLAQAKAHFTRLEADFKRAAELLRQRAVSQEEYERAAGELAEAQAALQAAQAALNLANLALEHTRVFAPVAGRISDRLLGVGSLATANTTSLATIDSVDPICVAFDVDERTFLKLRRSPSRRDGEPGLPVLVQLTDEKDFPHKSKVESADTRIDPATGTACWRALLPNPDGLLMPGMFARVRLVTSDPHEALLVPERVLCSGQGQKLVFIVTDQNVVQRRDVIVGELEDDGMRVVEQGLAADDWVIEKGLQQVAPGMPVKPQKSPPAISPSSPKEK